MAPQPGFSQSTRSIVDLAKSHGSALTTELRVLSPVGSQTNLAPVVDAWHKATGIKVEIQEADVDDITNRITLDYLASRTQYDVALPATFGLADLAWSGVIQPFTQFEPEHTPQGLHDGGNIIGGERFGFQTDGDVYLMFFREDWLQNEQSQRAFEERFGEPLGVPKTWEQLDRMMAFFHMPDDGIYGGALFRTPSYLVWEYWSRLHAKGILPFDAELRCQLTTEPAIAALDEMVAASAWLHPDTTSAGLFQNWELYEKGQIFCNIGWGGSQKHFNHQGSKIRGKTLATLLPGGARPSASYFNWGWSYVLPTSSAQPELGYLFSKFATSPEISTLAVQQDGYFDPFQIEHYSDAQIADVYSEQFLDVHRTAMQAPIPNLYLPGHGNYFASLAQNLHDANTGRRTSADALRKTETDWDLISQEFGLAQQAARWREVVENYPPAFQI